MLKKEGGFIFIFVFLLVSCMQNTEKDKNLKIFRYNQHANISSLDPAFARTQSNIWAVNQLFSGLVQLDDSLNVQPDIAKKWVISPNGKEYIFTLRGDVYFHKNQCFLTSNQTRKVTAYDFLYSFNRLKDSTLSASGGWILQNVAHFSAENDSIFKIELYEKFPAFLGLLTTKYASVVPKEAIDFYGADFRKNPVGTGAFQFQFWEENTKLILRKNPLYYEFVDAQGNILPFGENLQEAKRLPFLDAISISFLNEKQSEFLQFIQGNLDFINSVDASYKDEILTSEGNLQPKYQQEIQMLKSPYLNTEYLGITMEKASDVSKNQELRKAIHYGFDREKMMKYLRNNIGKPATGGFIPKGLEGFSDNLTKYQPEKAKKIVADFIKKNAKIPSLTITTDANYLDVCEYIQRELQSVGFQCDINVVPSATLRQSRAMGKLEAFRGSWIADYPDAENYLSLFYSENTAPFGANYTRFKNSDFDNWYREALAENSLPQRLILYKKMDSLLLEYLPVIPLYYDENVRFIHKNIEGMTSNPINLLHLKKVKKNN